MPIVKPSTKEQIDTFTLGKKSGEDHSFSEAKTAFETIHNLAKTIDGTCEKSLNNNRKAHKGDAPTSSAATLD